MKQFLNYVLDRAVENPKSAKILTFVFSWVITWLVAKLGFDNGKDWSAQIATFASLAATGLVAEIRNYRVSQNVRTIQQLLPQPLKENGVANTATVNAVAQVVQDAAMASDGAYPPMPPARPVSGEH